MSGSCRISTAPSFYGADGALIHDDRPAHNRARRSRRQRPDSNLRARPPSLCPKALAESTCATNTATRLAPIRSWSTATPSIIGIFDATCSQFMIAGFRGWSGSARHSFSIAADEATPGYTDARSRRGRGRSALGLYKIAPQGMRHHVEVTLTPGRSDGAFPAAAAACARRRARSSRRLVLRRNAQPHLPQRRRQRPARRGARRRGRSASISWRSPTTTSARSWRG